MISCHVGCMWSSRIVLDPKILMHGVQTKYGGRNVHTVCALYIYSRAEHAYAYGTIVQLIMLGLEYIHPVQPINIWSEFYQLKKIQPQIMQ